MRVPPSVRPPHTQLLSTGTPTRGVGEERSPKRLSARKTGERGRGGNRGWAGAWSPRTRWDPHHHGRVLGWKLYRLSSKEIRVNSDVGGSIEDQRCLRRWPGLYQSQPRGCYSSWQWSGGNLDGNRGKEGASCASRSGKLNRCNVLDDFQQTATIPRHVKALWQLSLRFRRRPGRGAGILGVENHLYRWHYVTNGEHQVPCRQRLLCL